MSGESMRPELVEALARGVGIRDLQPDIARSLSPVIIVEDISKGPFPPSRIWQAGVVCGAVAAQYSHVGIGNKDAPGKGSSVTVDYILARTSPAADDFAIVMGQYSAIGFPAEFNVSDCSNESQGQPVGSAFDPRIGNVVCSIFPNAAALNGQVVPQGDQIVHRIDGPWTLGPGGALYIRNQQVNLNLVAYFKGRYHVGV